MKKLIIFNPSIDGGGVERNIKLIFGSLNKKLHNKVYFVSCDKLKGLDKSIINVRPIINIKTRNRIIKSLFRKASSRVLFRLISSFLKSSLKTKGSYAETEISFDFKNLIKVKA